MFLIYLDFFVESTKEALWRSLFLLFFSVCNYDPSSIVYIYFLSIILLGFLGFYAALVELIDWLCCAYLIFFFYLLISNLS